MERPIDLSAKVTIEVGKKKETVYWVNPIVTKKKSNSNLDFIFRESLKKEK